jgi:hypothetical protein
VEHVFADAAASLEKKLQAVKNITSGEKFYKR